MATLSLVVVLGFIGCPKKPTESASQSIEVAPPSQPTAPPPVVETVPPLEPPRVVEQEVVKPVKEVSGLKDVFFDFDKAAITGEMKSTLEADAAWLKANAGAKIKIEGHCDERGTNEYNLALGEKRAHAVRQFLAAQGVASSRISTITYGEDRPFCTEHNESCYSQNRRAHFLMVR